MSNQLKTMADQAEGLRELVGISRTGKTTEFREYGKYCLWYVSGGLGRASCDKDHRGHGGSYTHCPYCGKPVRYADGEQGAKHELVSGYRPMDRIYLTTERLHEIRSHLLEGRQLQRGSDGFEVPTYVLPLSPKEAESIISELIARRAGHAK